MTLEEQNTMIIDNIPLVYFCINKYFPNYKINDDVMSSGKLGLVQAARTYDPSKNIKFSTYATNCIRNEIILYFRKESKHFSNISLNTPIISNGESDTTILDVYTIEDLCLDEVDNRDLILSFKKVLSDREFTYIILHYIGDFSQTELGALFGVSRAYINSTIKKGLKKLEKFLK